MFKRNAKPSRHVNTWIRIDNVNVDRSNFDLLKNTFGSCLVRCHQKLLLISIVYTFKMFLLTLLGAVSRNKPYRCRIRWPAFYYLFFSIGLKLFRIVSCFSSLLRFFSRQFQNGCFLLSNTYSRHTQASTTVFRHAIPVSPVLWTQIVDREFTSIKFLFPVVSLFNIYYRKYTTEPNKFVELFWKLST